MGSRSYLVAGAIAPPTTTAIPRRGAQRTTPRLVNPATLAAVPAADPGDGQHPSTDAASPRRGRLGNRRAPGDDPVGMVRTLTFAGFVAAALWVAPGSALAHTGADLVAVAAGDEAKVTLKPSHGCAGSPTVEVAVRAPVEGAIPGDVDGWTATGEPDGSGNTVLRWTGGSLPTDRTGAFPVTFTAPDTVGALLVFPSVQYCANGDELAWISGDPAAEFPAPRLLVLPAGSDEAETLDDVPADAPGRNQLIEVVDVDNPLAPSTTPPPVTTQPATTTAPATTPPATETASSSAAPTTVVTTTEPTTEPAMEPATTQASTPEAPPTTETPPRPDDDGSGATVAVVIGATVLVVALAASGLIAWRRRATGA